MFVDIEYCVPCGFQQQALDIQMILLETCEDDLGAVQLSPGHGGVFRVTVDGETVWDKDEENGIDTDAIVDRLDVE